MTEWRTVEEAPEYQVSQHGELRSIYTMRPLTGGRDKDGYRKAVLCTGGRRIHRRISALVCEAFNGSRRDGFVVRHLDGSRDNDAAANLAWGTQAENIADKIGHGTAQVGERHPQSKLTEASVRAIRASPDSCKTLAAKYGIATCTVSAVRTRRLWPHVK